MDSFIPAEKLITKAKKSGVDFGDTDPYNRLRYYTKIGWLPNMKRMQDSSGKVVGHYPDWALDTLVLIEGLKDEGLSNSEIGVKINANRAKRNLGNIFKFLSTPERRLRTAVYTSLVGLLAILLVEFGFLNLGQSNKQTLLSAPVTVSSTPNQIVASGAGVVPQSDTAIFVRATEVTPQSKVYVTFEDNYSPASIYWIARKISFEGFRLELDAPVAQNAKFNWWISN